jgi:diaminobutyrate-2-oxoglutarate transaminase
MIDEMNDKIINYTYPCTRNIDLTGFGEFLEKEILPLDSRLQMRGIGMIWGIEFENIPVDGLSERVTEKAFDRHLIVECAGRKNSVVKLMPPLVIEKEVLLEGLAKLKGAVEDCLADIK